MQLSVIIVNWNSLAFLRECLRTFYRETTGLSFEIIVVDNHSPEGGIATLRGQFPDIQIIESDRNLGFAAANNLGFAHSSGETLLFLNPDTAIIGAAVSVMAEQLRALPDAGIVGARLLNSDGTMQTSCIQTFPTILNQLLDIEFLRVRWPACSLWNIAPLYSRETKPSPVEVISGACMMMKRTVFERAGKFSEDYFMYAEDLDLSYKVMRLGLRNYYVGDAEVVHYGGGSSSQKSVSQWSTTMKLRAVEKFCSKTHGRLYGLCYRGAMGGAAIGRLLAIGLCRLFGSLVANRKALESAWSKWAAVLRWSVGMART